jgi:raffinose/stachyose/melibiose transport system substrate-binding protein
MKFKFIILAGLLMMNTFVLNACGIKDKLNTKENGTEDEKNIVLWSIATESDAFNGPYNKAIEDFENENPGVKIDHETFENESYKTKIKTAVSGNDLPDLFYTWAGGFSKPFVESGKVMDLTEYYEDYKDELPKLALNYTTYDDKIYGSTFTSPISVLYYNKKIFEENNLVAPETFEELKDVAEKLIEKDIVPIGISAKDTWVLAMTHDAMTLKTVGHEKLENTLLKEDGYFYEGEEFIQSTESFKELIDMGAFYENATGISNDEASAMFYEGKVAMYTTGTWMAGSIQTDAKNPEDFDVIQFPTLSENANLTDYMGGAVDTIMVSESTTNKELSGKAVFELTKSISKYAYLDGAGLTVWEKEYDDSSVNEMTKKLAFFVENATSFTMWFDTLMEADDSSEYLTLLQELYVGNITSEEFVESMNNQLKE